jgi:four helix bundle protein
LSLVTRARSSHALFQLKRRRMKSGGPAISRWHSACAGARVGMMTNDNNSRPSFHAYDIALELIRACRPLIERVARRDRSLAEQMRRAVQSATLNLREGNRRAGGDRLHSFRIAAGSADEVVGALEVAEAFGYLGASEIATSLALADRVLAMLYRLTAARR